MWRQTCESYFITIGTLEEKLEIEGEEANGFRFFYKTGKTVIFGFGFGFGFD